MVSSVPNKLIKKFNSLAYQKISSTKPPGAYLFQTLSRGSLIGTGGLYQKGGKDDEIFAYGFRNPGLWNPEHCSRNPESKFYQERIDHSLLVLLTKTGIQYLESGIHSVESRIQDCTEFPLSIGRLQAFTYLYYCLFLALVELITYCFQCLVYFLFQLHDIWLYYFLTYLLT